MSAAIWGGAPPINSIDLGLGWINVKNQLLYPVFGNGVNDDTANVQAIINANPGKKIYFPPGTYKKTSAWYNFNDNTELIGAGYNCCVILEQGNGSDVYYHYSLLTDTKSRYINGGALEGFLIYRNTVPGTLTGAIRLKQCNGFRLRDCIINDIPEGVVVTGGQLSRYEGLKFFTTGLWSRITDPTSAFLSFDEQSVAGGTDWQTCFTQVVSDIFIGGSRKTFASINIGSIDGLQISNGYMAGGDVAHYGLLPTRNGGYEAGVTVSNVYHDAQNNSTGTQYILYSQADAYPNFINYDITFTGGFMGNTRAGGILGRRPIRSLKLDGVQIANINTWPIDVEGDATASILTVSDVTVRGMGLLGGGTGFLRARNLVQFNATGNTVKDASGTGAVIQLIDTVKLYNIESNNFHGGTADFSTSNLVNTDYNVSGNVSLDNNPNTTLRGTRSSLNSTTAPFTLTPTFGGAAVGITTTTNRLTRTRIGNRIFFEGELQFSSLGSSTGIFAIGGLPDVANSGQDTPINWHMTGMANTVGTNYCSAKVFANGTTIQPYQMNATGALVALQNTDLGVTAHFWFSGSYLANS